MTVTEYDMEVREVAQLEDWVIVNQTYWYKGITKEEAVRRYKKRHRIAE